MRWTAGLGSTVRVVLLLGFGQYASSGQEAPASDSDPKDLFADVAPGADSAQAISHRSWLKEFFSDNFAFKKEIMSLFDDDLDGSLASRQSVGFDLLKRVSGATSSLASFDFQGRFVRRDGYNVIPSDMEGAARPGWAFEYHNLYLDLYNVLNPVLDDSGRARAVGKLNFRVGHFYVPFGLNLQTDTHGTLLQLSNGEDFGFERDWYAGFWGALNRHLNYDAYYLAGSGYDLKFKGQSGLGAVRISLSNKYSSEYGLEGGFSLIAGERLAPQMQDSAIQGGDIAGSSRPLKTQRAGIDARYRHTAPRGVLTFTGEFSGGRDGANPVRMQLGQADYLRASRRWGFAAQFRHRTEAGMPDNSSAIGEFTWYFRNDVGNTNAHWITLNVERQLHSAALRPHTVVTLQYYFYL
jgi:hypothetical protein